MRQGFSRARIAMTIIGLAVFGVFSLMLLQQYLVNNDLAPDLLEKATAWGVADSDILDRISAMGTTLFVAAAGVLCVVAFFAGHYAGRLSDVMGAQEMAYKYGTLKEIEKNEAQTKDLMGGFDKRTSSIIFSLTMLSRELKISSQKIVDQAQQALTSEKSKNVSRAATAEIKKLMDAAAPIREAAAAIKEMGEQITLLTLNSRLREGRGEGSEFFTNAAAELKRLVGATAEKAQEIDRRIAALEHSVNSVVDAVENMTGSGDDTDDAREAVYAGVEKQKRAIGDVASLTAELRSEVGRFLADVRGDTGLQDNAPYKKTAELTAAFREPNKIPANG